MFNEVCLNLILQFLDKGTCGTEIYDTDIAVAIVRTTTLDISKFLI